MSQTKAQLLEGNSSQSLSLSSAVVAVGSAGSPSVTFTGDLNTGIYSPGADQVAISTSGTGRLFITSAGNIGVGVSPTTAEIGKVVLDVSGPLLARGAVSGNQTSAGVFQHSSDITAIRSYGATANSGVITFSTGGGGSADTERARIDSSGRLLVSTSSSRSWSGVASALQVESTGIEAGISQIVNSNDATGPLAAFAKSRGTANGSNTVVQSGDSLGKLHFLGADGSALRQAAAIEAVVDATPGASDMPGRLVFSTTADGASSPTERMRISSTGLVDIPGGTSGSYYSQQPSLFGVFNTSSSGQCLVHINGHSGNGSGANTYALRVSQNVDANGDTSAALRIDHSNPLGGTGGALIQAFGNQGNSTTQRIWQVNNVGAQLINRPTGNGTLIDFQASQVSQGSISVSGTTVSYNAFLGSHWAVLSDWSRPEIEIGTILEAVNEIVVWKYALIDVDGKEKKICYNGNEAEGEVVTVEYKGQQYQGTLHVDGDQDFEKSIKVKVNDTAGSKAVYGVFVGWNAGNELDGGTWNDMYVGAVGNYVIRMAAGQTPEIGDLIEADGTGCGVVQDDDIIRTKTVGKITTTTPQVTYEDGSFLVTCVLYCG